MLDALAQLFNDKLHPELAPKFDIERAIVRGVSKVDSGIARLDLLPSSIEFIEIQEKLPVIAMHGNYAGQCFVADPGSGSKDGPREGSPGRSSAHDCWDSHTNLG